MSSKYRNKVMETGGGRWWNCEAGKIVSLERYRDTGEKCAKGPWASGFEFTAKVFDIGGSRILQGQNTIRIFSRHDKLKRQYWGRQFWAQGYCVSTVGLDKENILKYVRWQQAQDKNMDQLTMSDY